MKEIIITQKRPKCKHSVMIEEISKGYICSLALHINLCDGYLEDRKACPAWRGME